MLYVNTARWNQTPDDLRRLAVQAPHARTRERFQALYEVTQEWSAFSWSKETDRRHSTILEWIRKYNEHGPDALTFARTGGRPPLSPNRRVCR
jgi:transposase